MPHTSAQVAVTNASRLKSASIAAAVSHGNVKQSLTSHANVRKLSGVMALKSGRQPPVTCEDTAASKRASRPPVPHTTGQPLTSAKSISRSQSVAAAMNSLESRGGCTLNRRRSYTTQFRSAADQHRTVQQPPAVTQPRAQSAAERRKSYHTQVVAKQKTAVQAPNLQSRRDLCGKSSHTQLNSKKKAEVEVPRLQSCHDRRKSYHAELLGRRRTTVVASQKPAPRRSDTGLIEKSVSKVAAENPRISTPFSSRRTVATTTPSLSCIPPRKTVSFLTPSTSHKSTPRLHRTQPVNKEMSIG